MGWWQHVPVPELMQLSNFRVISSFDRSANSLNKAYLDVAPSSNFPFQKTYSVEYKKITPHQTLKKGKNVIVSLASCGLHKISKQSILGS